MDRRCCMSHIVVVVAAAAAAATTADVVQIHKGEDVMPRSQFNNVEAMHDN